MADTEAMTSRPAAKKTSGRTDRFDWPFSVQSSRRTKSRTMQRKIGKKVNDFKASGPDDLFHKNSIGGGWFYHPTTVVRPDPITRYGTTGRFLETRGEHHEMETDVIALATQFDVIHPDNGRIIKVVGIDGSSAFSPKLIVLVTDVTGTHVEALDYVKNKRPGA
ncbi:MAG: hypothetical protein E5Y10_16020 [Mesorhizobium sp.]|uniref:hypothetical protein n=1 Tax=Mesorhizobium sp. TaxID=1871066 RepID=UPI0011FB2C3C|nr:hypothetical protein [Mesorhizobium sp.]TIN41637.1 MAG: hypothetical protein E5Y13_07155 [Mesorhizobium sp.]TJU88526.1 MAG: hypothetical protein E5Y10_16020 [Mesorhizobium sp.]